MKKIIHSKYFNHVLIGLILIIVIYVIWNKYSKEKQVELLMAAIGDPKTQGGGYSDMKLSNAFNPTYFVGKAVEPLWDKTANIIEKIYNKGNSTILNPIDDEEAILALFKRFVSQRQVSYIADAFNKKYGKDMYAYLNSFMSNQIIGQRQLGTTNNMVQLKKITDSLKP